ncbi:MAG TPA: hypothetical protein PKD80_18290, partial [Microthrixaceae bacterium]|nr:hypothetical protein [Microthrixaceae bacterium]
RTRVGEALNPERGGHVHRGDPQAPAPVALAVVVAMPGAARLGVRGSWTWRLADGSLIDLAQFVDASLAGYRALDPRDVRLDHIDGDERFERELA